MDVIRIGLSVVLILGGIGGIISSQIVSAIFCILTGISLIPALYKKLKIDNNYIQVAVPIVLFILCVVSMGSNETAYTNTSISKANTVNLQNTQVNEISAEKKAEQEIIEAEKKAEEERAQKEAEEQQRKAAEEEQRQKAEQEAQRQKEAAAAQQRAAAAATTTKQSQSSQTSSGQSNISNSQTVYVTPTGKRYHLSPTCGGKNSTAATLSKAQSMGLTPCKKCAQ